MTSFRQGQALRLYLAALHGDGLGYAEVRYRRNNDGRFCQAFFELSDRDRMAELIDQWSVHADVYVGVLVRGHGRPGGGVYLPSRVLWADCDTPEAVERARNFERRPNIVVETSPGRAHVYWVTKPLEADRVFDANLRLASHLGADPNSCDPARILRPPETINHKGEVPNLVVCREIEASGPPPEADHVVGHLADAHSSCRRLLPRIHRGQIRHEDGLDRIPSVVYAAFFTRSQPTRGGKLVCPFHPDTDPSLQTYVDPDRGWYCFGCGRGGSIIDWGAVTYGIEPRGAGYWEIRRRLSRELAALGNGIGGLP